MHLPQIPHMEVVIRILRYLKGTSSRGVFFGKNCHLDLMIYTDVDWASDRDSRKSTSGYFTVVEGNLVTWRSKKQKVVALSSVEAEFRGVAKGITEIIWLKKLLCELNFPPTETCKLFCDNQAVINISEKSVQHDRTKYVEIDSHFIMEKFEKKIISIIPHVKSEDQLADILTKVVTAEVFESTLSKLGIENPMT